MKSYDVVSIEHSIVQPGFADMELRYSDDAGKPVMMTMRLPLADVENIQKKDIIKGFALIDGTPVAYCINGKLYMSTRVGTGIASNLVTRGLPGVLEGSLDTARFRYALMRELWNRKQIPHICASKNIERLMRQK